MLTLREAVWADRGVAFTYTDRAGIASKRAVDPFGLVAKAGVWYLVARDAVVLKTFRVQRITEPQISSRSFTRPAGFDLAAYWNSVAETMREKPTPLRATIEMNDRALANAQVYLDVKSHAAIDGSSPRVWRVEVEFFSFDAALFEIAGWSGGAIVVEPPELREGLAARGRDLIECYAPSLS